jgi:hypothetical protein
VAEKNEKSGCGCGCLIILALLALIGALDFSTWVFDGLTGGWWS